MEISSLYTHAQNNQRDNRNRLAHYLPSESTLMEFTTLSWPRENSFVALSSSWENLWLPYSRGNNQGGSCPLSRAARSCSMAARAGGLREDYIRLVAGVQNSDLKGLLYIYTRCVTPTRTKIRS